MRDRTLAGLRPINPSCRKDLEDFIIYLASAAFMTAFAALPVHLPTGPDAGRALLDGIDKYVRSSDNPRMVMACDDKGNVFTSFSSGKGKLRRLTPRDMLGMYADIAQRKKEVLELLFSKGCQEEDMLMTLLLLEMVFPEEAHRLLSGFLGLDGRKQPHLLEPVLRRKTGFEMQDKFR